MKYPSFSFTLSIISPCLSTQDLKHTYLGVRDEMVVPYHAGTPGNRLAIEKTEPRIAYHSGIDNSIMKQSQRSQVVLQAAEQDVRYACGRINRWAYP